MLNIAVIKARCSKADFVEALLKASFGVQPDDAISHYLIQLGARKLSLDLSHITDAEASAKRPRGSPLKAAGKGKSKPDAPSQSASGAGSHTQIIGDNNAVNSSKPFPKKK